MNLFFGGQLADLKKRLQAFFIVSNCVNFPFDRLLRLFLYFLADPLSMSNTKVIRAIACGYERGGTTMLSQVLGQHPRLESGFECGMLLAASPKDFLSSKFKDYNRSLIRNGWGITEEDLQYIAEAENWNRAYLRLRERAKVIKNKHSLLYDKTPAYMRALDEILIKIDQVKSIVIIKQPLGVLWSWIKRRKNPFPPSHSELTQMCNRYLIYAESFEIAAKHHPRRVMPIKYGEFCKEPEPYIRDICSFLDLEYCSEMLTFEQKYEVHGSNIDDSFVDEYKSGLTEGQIDFITKNTKGVFAGY